MGYYTDYQLDPNARSILISYPYRIRQVIEEFIQLEKGNDPYSYLLDAWLSNGSDLTWYDHQKDMAKLSAAFPDVLFTLSGAGQESDDLWKEYYLRGKVQAAKGEIVYPKFDERMLEDVE